MAFKALNDPSSVGADFSKLFRYAREAKGIKPSDPWPFEMWHAWFGIFTKHGYKLPDRLYMRVCEAQASGQSPEQLHREIYGD
jgi:hypothetical protein